MKAKTSKNNYLPQGSLQRRLWAVLHGGCQVHVRGGRGAGQGGAQAGLQALRQGTDALTGPGKASSDVEILPKFPVLKSMSSSL